MKVNAWHGLVFAGITIPLLLLVAGVPTWASGFVMGEFLGTVSFVWVGFTVRRSLSKAEASIHRKFILHWLGRFLFLGVMFYIAVRWSAVEIWAVVIGYTFIQLPAAILRAKYS